MITMDDALYRIFNDLYTRKGIKANIDKNEYLEIMCDIETVRLTDRNQLYLDCVFKKSNYKKPIKISLLVHNSLYSHTFSSNKSIDGLIKINELGQYVLVSLFEESDNLINNVKYCSFCGKVYRDPVSNCTRCGCAMVTTNNVYKFDKRITV